MGGDQYAPTRWVGPSSSQGLRAALQTTLLDACSRQGREVNAMKAIPSSKVCPIHSIYKSN